MANANVGFGMKPINTAGSTPATSGTNAYHIKSNASAIYQGSPVIATNDGTVAVSSSASGDTLKFLGVFAGCEYVSSSTGKKVFSNYWPGSGADTNFDIIANVYDNPMQRYIVCSDASLTDKATAIAAIFESAEFSAESNKGAADGSTTTGISAAQLDVSTVDAADLSHPLKIVGILDDPENADFTAAGIPLIVMINNHALTAPATGGSAEGAIS
jgi:hypothetical protein